MAHGVRIEGIEVKEKMLMIVFIFPFSHDRTSDLR